MDPEELKLSDQEFDTMLNEIDENEQKSEYEDSQNELEEEMEIKFDDDDDDMDTPSLSKEEITKIDTVFLLDEIAENEKKYELNRIKSTDDDNVDWNEIMDALRAKNTNFIKNKLSSKQIGVNAQNPDNGKTLLIYAVVIGDYDLVKGTLYAHTRTHIHVHTHTAILNVGADVSIKDKHGMDALDYAIKFGQYKITELVYYRQLSGKTGNDLKLIKTEIFRKKKEAKYIKKTSPNLTKEITEFMIAAITEREAFDPSMLFYAWYFNGSSMTSPLYKVMMETYEQILSDTSDKKGWKWLRENFLDSLIWFCRHPHFILFNEERLRKYEAEFNAQADGEELEVKYIKTEHVPKMIESLGYFPFTLALEKTAQKVQIGEFKKIADPTGSGKVSFNSFVKALKEKFAPCPYFEDRDKKKKEDGGDEDEDANEEKVIESTLEKTLFYELLRRVRTESKKQSDLLLNDEINKIKKEQANDWSELIKYNVISEQSSDARQDAYILPLYKEDDLSEDKFPPSTHFSAKKFYDTSIYLNDLMFTANIINDKFQRDMMRITKQIAKEMNDDVLFRMGMSIYACFDAHFRIFCL